MSSPLYVTKPFLPELSDFTPYLEKIWESNILTNGGPFHQQLEQELADYLGVKHVCLFANGTLALITALQSIRVSGDVITTPFSFPATSHALHWNGLKPVFCDVEEGTYNLDPEKIERCITPETTAILPVHVYGHPCKMERIQEIAFKHGLKVIYDAAHCFGVDYKDESILNFGDLSILSFHATKIFNTFEGGAIICHNEVIKKRIDHLKNFGYENEVTVVTPGMNSKMNELQAAMGLLQLKSIDERISSLKNIYNAYREQLKDLEGITFLNEIEDVKHNYAYFPILIDEYIFGVSRDVVYETLKEYNIHVRRYFYPLISEFPMYSNRPSANPVLLETATEVSRKVLCLPNHSKLTLEEVTQVCNALKSIKQHKSVPSLIASY